MLSCAHIHTFRWLCTTGNGRVHHLVATETTKFIETNIVTCVAVATVTELLATVRAAREFPAAYLFANVLCVLQEAEREDKLKQERVSGVPGKFPVLAT